MKKQQIGRPAHRLDSFLSDNSAHISAKDRAALRQAAAKWIRGEHEQLDDHCCPDWLLWEFRRAVKNERYFQRSKNVRFTVRTVQVWL